MTNRWKKLEMHWKILPKRMPRRSGANLLEYQAAALPIIPSVVIIESNSRRKGRTRIVRIYMDKAFVLTIEDSRCSGVVIFFRPRASIYIRECCLNTTCRGATDLNLA